MKEPRPSGAVNLEPPANPLSVLLATTTLALDLRSTTVSAPVKKADQMLVEEVERRRPFSIPGRTPLRNSPFGTAVAIDNASKDELTAALLSIHAFREQLRVKSEFAKCLLECQQQTFDILLAFDHENYGRLKYLRKSIAHLPVTCSPNPPAGAIRASLEKSLRLLAHKPVRLGAPSSV